MSIVVFWVEDDCPGMTRFADVELMQALALSKKLRQHPAYAHVIISTELEDSIGKAGVDSVENGKTPDGNDYTWKMRRL